MASYAPTGVSVLDFFKVDPEVYKVLRACPPVTRQVEEFDPDGLLPGALSVLPPTDLNTKVVGSFRPEPLASSAV